MFSISHRWNSTTTSCLSDRNKLPSIKRFTWAHVDGASEPAVHIASRFASYFGLDNWNFLRNKDDQVYIIQSSDSWIQKEIISDSRIQKVFQQCSPRRNENLFLKNVFSMLACRTIENSPFKYRQFSTNVSTQRHRLRINHHGPSRIHP